ncbi:MAG: cytochrome b [Burkholderiaceae bacterium]
MPSRPTTPSHSAPRYSGTAIALHWVLGLALIGLIGMGLYMTGLPFSPQRLKLYNWHKWAGMTVLALSALRLLWRLTHRPPALPSAIAQAMPRWQSVAHHATHVGLYLLFFTVPLLGWAYSSAAGFPVVLFGALPLPDLVAANPDLAETLKPLHKFSAYAMAALILLHVAGALKHQWIDRDGLLQRMLPGRG